MGFYNNEDSPGRDQSGGIKIPVTISQLKRVFENLPEHEGDNPYYYASLPIAQLEKYDGETKREEDPVPVVYFKLQFEWKPELRRWAVDTSAIQIVDDY